VASGRRYPSSFAIISPLAGDNGHSVGCVGGIEPIHPIPHFNDSPEVRVALQQPNFPQPAFLDGQNTFEMRTLTKETGAYMFITHTVAKEGQDFRNEAVLLSPTGDFSLIYGDNTHLVNQSRLCAESIQCSILLWVG
jgi:hypothetical protein